MDAHKDGVPWLYVEKLITSGSDLGGAKTVRYDTIEDFCNLSSNALTSIEAILTV